MPESLQALDGVTDQKTPNLVPRDRARLGQRRPPTSSPGLSAGWPRRTALVQADLSSIPIGRLAKFY